MPEGLPPGLAIDPDTGDVTGEPQATGAYTFTVRVIDATGLIEYVSDTITVNPA